MREEFEEEMNKQRRDIAQFNESVCDTEQIDEHSPALQHSIDVAQWGQRFLKSLNRDNLGRDDQQPGPDHHF